jgi:hypothetical protein
MVLFEAAAAMERAVKCPVAIAMGLAEFEVGQSEDEDVLSLTVHPFGTSKLALEDINQAVDLRPANLLELALFESRTIRPVYLDDIRAEYCHNDRLDAIAKITMARERRFGDAWVEEGSTREHYSPSGPWALILFERLLKSAFSVRGKSLKR